MAIWYCKGHISAYERKQRRDARRYFPCPKCCGYVYKPPLTTRL